MLLLVLGLFAAVLYLGPVYPSTVQQLHLHLRLPQLSDGVSLGVAEAALLMEQGVKQPRQKGGSGSTLSFDVCSGFATLRVALVSGGDPTRCPPGGQVALEGRRPAIRTTMHSCLLLTPAPAPHCLRVAVQASSWLSS